MPSPVNAGDFLRKCKSFGISVRQGGRGSHLVLTKEIQGSVATYVVPVHRNKVDPVYVPKTRKTFKMTPKDGVSDREWNSP